MLILSDSFDFNWSVSAYKTPDVPPVAATSPTFKTFNATALFGWSPDLYFTGIPIGKPVFSDANFVTYPWSLKFSTIFGVSDESIW